MVDTLHSSPKHSPKNILRLNKLQSTNLNQDTIMKSLAVSLASRVSGSVHESFMGNNQSSKVQNNEMGGYSDRIQNLSIKINSQITDLDDRLDQILEKHEKDFLTAYRYHMLKVQKELVALKQKANENELKNQQESRINELEKQTQMFREQCMKLRNKCDAQDKTLDNLKNSIDELEDDRKFLDYEIRDSRLQNKMLKITLSKQHNECEEISQINQTTKDQISNLQNQTMINRTFNQQQEQNQQQQFQLNSQMDSIQNQTQNFNESNDIYLMGNQQLTSQFKSNQQQQSYFDKDTTEMTTARLHGVKDQSQSYIKDSHAFKIDPLRFVEGSVQEEEYEETLQLNTQQVQNQGSGNNNLYATFMKESQQQQQDNIANSQLNKVQILQDVNSSDQQNQNEHLEAEETQYDKRTSNSEQQLNTYQQDLSPLNLQDSYEQQNLADHSKISQQQYQNSNINQTQKLKYMSKISQGYKEGRGPGDLKKTFMYNAKFTQQLFDILELTQKQVAPTAVMVEQLFEEDTRRRQEMAEHLRVKLAQQKQINLQKQQQIQLQKQMLQQKKESEVLVQTFKNCIDAVILDKKDRLNISQNVKKDQLYGSDKKRILELFVENDHTLSHLLEFISSKLINDGAQDNKSEASSKKSFSRQLKTTSVQRPINNAPNNDAFIQRQNVVNSQLSGTGEILNQDLIQNINKQSSTINHYNLHIPIKSMSSDINQSSSMMYYNTTSQQYNQNPQSKLTKIQDQSSLLALENPILRQQQLNNNNSQSNSQIQYQAIAFKNIDPLIAHSQNNSTMRGDPSPNVNQSNIYNGVLGSTGGQNSNANFASKTTLRMAGQASITKSSQGSIGQQSSAKRHSSLNPLQ
eukprot:403345473